MHVLIIEDQPAIASLLAEELRDFGYVTSEIVRSEEAGVAAASRQCPDLIVADVRIRGGSGIDAVRRICADRPLPVIFVVANPWDVRLALPDAIIVEKPFTGADLGRALEMATAVPLLIR